MGDLKRIAPIFAARDLDSAMEHYDRLGFATRRYEVGGYGFATRDGIRDPSRCRTRRGSQDGRGVPLVEDADELAATWRAAGVDVHPPEDTEWGHHEGAVVDPDGKVIRFGSPSRPTTPDQR